MTRFLAWFRFEWRTHAKLVLACAAASLLILWVALLLGRSEVGRRELAWVLVGVVALMGIILGAGLFGSERRHGADALLVRTPRARGPLFLARLAWFASALGFVTLVAAFGAARLLPSPPPTMAPASARIGWFLWPRDVAGDALVLAVGMGMVAVLASAWLRNVALAIVLGVVLPVAVLFPWIYLGAERSDFYPFWRLGAIPVAAWPLLAATLLALAISWLLGRRRLNRPQRAWMGGLAVMVGAVLVAGAWTSVAFARFDALDPQGEGFTLVPYVVKQHRPSPYSLVPSEPIALTPDGRSVWVHGYRHDAGAWPEAGYWNPNIQHADGTPVPPRDFRLDRGTWSRQVRIDLETGEAQVLGDVKERIGWMDLGSGDTWGWLRHPNLSTRLAPRGHALFGRTGHGAEARLLDLETGRFVGAPLGTWDRETRRRAALQINPHVVPVRRADGVPVWLEAERVRGPDGDPLGGRPRLAIVSATSRREIDDPRVLERASVHLRSWQAVRDGWVRHSGTPRLLTLDTEGRVRASKADWLRDPRLDHVRGGGANFLDTRHVLLPKRRASSGEPYRWMLLDLETGTLTEPAEQPTSPNRVLWHASQEDGALLVTVDAEGGRSAIALWDPRQGTLEPLATPSALEPLGARALLVLHGGDGRGNAVFHVHRITPQSELPWPHASWLLYFRAASKTLHVLSSIGPVGTDGGFQFIRHPLGIDREDRLVGIGEQGRRIVRFDPADGSFTVLFPKRARGPLREGDR